MNQAITQFRENIARVKALAATIKAVDSITTQAVDLSDFLRAEIVLAISALDHFIHELVRLGMLEICSGPRRPTDAYHSFLIPLQYAHSAQSCSLSDQMWLDQAIRERHSWLSFQDPDKIADAIRLISSVHLWEEVGREIGKPAKDIKSNLKVIVDRRNKIAHEADIDPTNPGVRWPITQQIASQTVDFVESITEAIYKVTN